MVVTQTGLKTELGKIASLLHQGSEGALLTVAGKAGLQKKVLESRHPFLGEIPFDSERKRMSVLRQSTGKRILFTKGAPDIVLNRSESILTNGKPGSLSPEQKNKVMQANEKLAGQALRVLAVARELGLMNENVSAINGQDLDPMSDEELKNNVKRFVVYSRVSAEHKLRIVRAWKNAGEIVAMTGDGVNDALAIKEADIGSPWA